MILNFCLKCVVSTDVEICVYLRRGHPHFMGSLKLRWFNSSTHNINKTTNKCLLLLPSCVTKQPQVTINNKNFETIRSYEPHQFEHSPKAQSRQ